MFELSNAVAVPILAAADWFEILAALAFLIATGIAQLLQKRTQNRTPPAPESDGDKDDAPLGAPETLRDTGPTRQAGGPPPTALDWEEQLRRLFQPETPHPQVPEGPPVLTGTPDRVAPNLSGDDPGARSGRSSAGTGWPPTSIHTVPEPSEGPQTPSRVGARIDVASRLAAAAKAFQRAASLDQRAAARLRTAQERASGTGRGASPAPAHPSQRRAASVRALFKNPGTARQAVVAVSILERPKGLGPA